jgi:hypothetical protein
MDKYIVKSKSQISNEFIYSISSKKSKGLPYYHLIVDKELFELTYNFKLKDWKNIRTDYYWNQNIKTLTEQKRKEFLLHQVKAYIKS